MSYAWGVVGLSELCMGISGVSYVIRGGTEVTGSYMSMIECEDCGGLKWH